MLESVRRARTAGYAILLVTGRILTELREVFPDFEDHFDAVVAENGAVLLTVDGTRPLQPPVFPGLVDALRQRRIHLRTGEVLIACHARDASAALEEIQRLGLDSQLIFNRSELMILPAGVTKATGLTAALDELGISHHNAIGMGDGENDQALLDECELGIAVANAVDSLRLRADRVTDQPAGEGVREVLDGPLLGGVAKLFTDRWQVQLGTDSHGSPVSVPSSQLNVLICGESGAGKSHLSGLFAERLIALGYCVLVVDPEGDHLGLAQMRGTVRLSAADGLPAPVRVVQTLTKDMTSVVLDLSGVSGQERDEYLLELGQQVALNRHAFGLPHWVLTDEAQDAPDVMTPTARIPTQSNWGYALVSWRPGELDAQTLDQLDAVITVGSSVPTSEPIREVVCRVSGLHRDVVDEVFADMTPGQAFAALPPTVGQSKVFTVASRLTKHVRHWHKYTAMRLDPQRWFYFRDRLDQPGGSAANLSELQVVLARCSDEVLVHHAQGHELSEWIRQVFQDASLADELAIVENRIATGSTDPGVARMELMSAVRRKYGV